MDKLMSMRVFRQVVESGSFVAAAEQLDISAPMVSKHIMALEQRMSVRLLNRSSHKLALTEPGTLYFERCKAILDELHETERELESFHSTPSGTLRIALCETCIPGLGLGRDFSEYRRRWPQVVLDISFADGNGCAEGNHDLAFRLVGNDSLPPDMVARPVRRVPFRLAASRAYLERHGVPKEANDLCRHDFISHGGPDSVVLTGPSGKAEVPLKTALRCRTMADVAIAVASGVGIGLLPAALFNDPAFAGALRPLLIDLSPPESTLYMLYRTRRHLSLNARNFIDLVLEPGGNRDPLLQGTAPPATKVDRSVRVPRPTAFPVRQRLGDLSPALAAAC